MAEALYKLGYQPTFISAVGNDSHGQYLQSLLPSSCSWSIEILSSADTAQCIIIFDCNGDCKMLLGDMEIHQQITPDMVYKQEEIIKRSPLLILDGNLSIPTMSAALEIAEKFDVPVFFEPTDIPVSIKPFQTSHWRAVKYITPNASELKEIANTLNVAFPTNEHANELVNISYIAKAVSECIPNVIVTLSSNGLLMVRKGNASDPLLSREDEVKTKDPKIQVRHYHAKKVNQLINVSGAGDCLASGLVAAMLKGLSEEQCVNVGYAAAEASLHSHSPVPDKFNKDVDAWVVAAEYKTLL